MVDTFSVEMQDPIPILLYARKFHLLGLIKFCTGDGTSTLAKALKTKKDSFGKKYKFGIQLHMGVKQAMDLDKRNGNTLWLDAIGVELQKLEEFGTFKVLDKGEEVPHGFQQIQYHWVFDIKFDLRCCARAVAGGNWTVLDEDPYSGVVGLETVRLGIFLRELNQLLCCTADVGNAYLNGRMQEKVYFIAGPEFGDKEEQVLVLVRALYGLRSSSARWWEHLAEKLRVLDLKTARQIPTFITSWLIIIMNT